MISVFISQARHCIDYYQGSVSGLFLECQCHERLVFKHQKADDKISLAAK